MTQPQPATQVRPLLEDAAKDARFASKIETADDGASLELTVYSKAPFHDVESADEWLEGSGIAATATLSDGGCLVITLRTAASVHQLITVLLDPWIRAHTTATQLVSLLQIHSVTGADTAVSETDSIELYLVDDMLESSVHLAALLGTPGIGVDLELQRYCGMRWLTQRVQWLVSGVVGSAVKTRFEPGCLHEADRLTLHLTIPQARLLAQRIAHLMQAAPPVTRAGSTATSP